MWITEYRDLIWNLTISDLKVKYQSSVLGFAWSLLNPLLMMLVLYFVFSNIFRFEQEHFALYLLIGIIAWRFLANGTMMAMGSIVGRAALVTKVFIPRQILVLSSVLSAFISSILEFIVLIPLLFILGVGLSYTFLFFPLIHLVYFLMVYGASLILASLYVYFRDLNQIWDVVLQAGFFLSPIVYPISIIPVQYLEYYMLNPITVLIEVYRDVLLYGEIPSLPGLLGLIGFGALILLAGTLLFNRLERRFAEVI
ncbi:lipopolysaccharide transport system permease protein [Methanocalculus sp. AMF5]|uniref:ABC transporter permease n=1 Tax=Methanocalculus sp. AMF5 TaxID=1198257 RepID=UPI0020A03607|nr:ABC transporter permease [Methanocalculus sp. AMF5]MCP1662282.1 lipopolysaccharide transport system permease protein [Methanocalculus sp. AMF5]